MSRQLGLSIGEADASRRIPQFCFSEKDAFYDLQRDDRKCIICDALRELVLFVQFKNVKNT